VQERVIPSSGEDPLQAGAERIKAMRFHSRSSTLHLSRSRTYDAALEIFKAYKLSGNFHVNLAAVLKDLGFHDMITYQVEPRAAFEFPDCRHVVFTARDIVPGDRFDAIVRTIKDRIGFDVPWWVRLLRPVHREVTASARMCCASPQH
jgi:hypothetical protein